MRRPSPLLEREDRLITNMGGVVFSDNHVVLRGYDLHVDLADMDWMALYLFGITGRRFTPAQLRVLNAIWTTTSYPEPRLWNNRICAIAGTARSTGALAVGAAVAVSEASIYGRRPDIRAIDFLLRTRSALDQGADLLEHLTHELHQYRNIYGYGRPITREDERIPHLMKIVMEAGLDQGPYVLLAFGVEKLLLAGRWRLHMNVAALDAALGADMGMSAREYYLFMIPCFVAGMLPCLIDGATQPEGGFLPLRCERISYEGAPRRTWN